MKDLILRLAALFLWLPLFFNLQSFDIISAHASTIVPIVYALGLLAVLMPLSISSIRRFPKWAFAAALLALYGIALLVGPHQPYERAAILPIATGATFLLVTLLLALRIGDALGNFYQAVELLTFAQYKRDEHTLKHLHHRIETEVYASRRMQRPLSVIVIQTDEASSNDEAQRMVMEVQRDMIRPFVIARTAHLLTERLRRTDIVVEANNANRLLVVAPNTSKAEGDAIAKRIRGMLYRNLELNSFYSVATFPEQGVTFESLIHSADRSLTEHDRHDISNSSETEPLDDHDSESGKQSAISYSTQILSRPGGKRPRLAKSRTSATKRLARL